LGRYTQNVSIVSKAEDTRDYLISQLDWQFAIFVETVSQWSHENLVFSALAMQKYVDENTQWTVLCNTRGAKIAAVCNHSPHPKQWQIETTNRTGSHAHDKHDSHKMQEKLTEWLVGSDHLYHLT